MLSVEEAKNILLKNVEVLPKMEIKISDALNYVLAENIFSPMNLPPFNQSAMDGYAMCLAPTLSKGEGENNFFKVIGEIKAGDNHKIKLKKRDAVRIFTGAPVPASANCVIMQEKVKVENDIIFLNGYIPKQNENIRLTGSQIKKSELALKKGTILSPAAIGFLASLGINKISVFRKPVVSIIITGNELQTAGKKLKEGQIYESNSFTLNAALRKMNVFPVKIFRTKDEKKILSEKIKNALSLSDVVLISGGISVGKYDLVKECLEENNVKEIFYKVAQKPGKPLFVGKYLTLALSKGEGVKEKIIFALPGNSAATLVCFYEYVYPVIKKMLGFSDCFLLARKMKILNDVKKKSDRAYFLKGKIINDGVISLDGQESYMLKSFTEADVLIYLPAEKCEIKKGEPVEIHFL